MPYTSADDLTDVIKIQMSSSSTLITADGWEQVAEMTMNELGWDYPVSNPTQMFWAVTRGVRHACFILMIAAAHKFKYKQANINQRFDHYKELIAELDKKFEAGIESDPTIFANVEAYKLFGTKIDAGFKYNSLGEDLTYRLDALVNFSPSDDDPKYRQVYDSDVEA